ncbi:MAG: tRNA dihydrouridine synthase DusB [Bacteroidales bacterium]|nr:tRNA dihydrouridine synthase DusB [Bacteroidales bacterium]
MKLGHIDIGNIPLMLAPMENITDSVYRQICRRHGADMVFTEFISSEALARDIDKSKSKFNHTEQEKPIGIQIFGHDPENMALSARMAEQANPLVIDLNFGCPVRKVVAKGGGAALLKDVNRMIAITKAVVKAVDIPVTAKTRLGWDINSVNIKEVAFRLQDAGIDMLTIHGRTRSQMYGGVADWEIIGEIARHPYFTIPLIGNGDIQSAEDAKMRLENYPVDGLMIGRSAMGYPWIFNEIKSYLHTGTIPVEPNIKERISVCRNHLKQSIPAKGEERAVFEMRKFYKNYFKGIHNFKPFRTRLFGAKSLAEVNAVLEEINDEFIDRL